MRRFIIAAIATVTIVAFGQIASAADMPAKVAPAYAPAPAYNWSGFYVGLNAGAALGSAHTRTNTVFSPTGYFAVSSTESILGFGNQHPNDTSFTGGIQFGYNWQINNTVVGLETDFGYLGLKASALSRSLYPCCAPTSYAIDQSAKADWLWTLRPRVGVIGPYNTLLYVTGGLAVTEIKGNFLFTDTFATAQESASVSKTKAGWVAGLGAETAWAGPWTVRFEYLHVSFDSASTTSTNLTAFTPPIAFPTNVFTHSVSFSDEIVRVALNYRFQ